MLARLKAKTMTTDQARRFGPGEATQTSERAIAEVEAHAAHNYHPLRLSSPRARACGSRMWTASATSTCLSAYSAVNLKGTAIPRVIQALVEGQAGRITLTSRAFHNDPHGRLPSSQSGRVRVHRVRNGLPMNTGAEAVETSISGPPLGHAGEGHPGRPGARNRRLRRELPRPYDHDRVVLDRPRRAHRLRPVHTGLQDHSLQRSGGPRKAAIHQEHLRFPGRAHPGRGRREDSRIGFMGEGATTFAPARASCSSPTKCKPVSATRGPSSPAITT